jgi:hypothetical protein
MIKTIKITFVFALISIFVFACSNSEEYLTPESVIEANAKYMTEENFDKVMDTIDKDSPAYASSESMVKKLFDLYDLNYKIISMKVINESNDEAQVEFVQETTKIKGPAFKNNRVDGVHILKRDDNSWKIYSTKITNIQYLD